MIVPSGPRAQTHTSWRDRYLCSRRSTRAVVSNSVCRRILFLNHGRRGFAIFGCSPYVNMVGMRLLVPGSRHLVSGFASLWSGPRNVCLSGAVVKASAVKRRQRQGARRVTENADVPSPSHLLQVIASITVNDKRRQRFG